MEALPYPPDPADVWPPGLEQAFTKINDIYHTASEYLTAESYDLHRLRFYIGRIDHEVYPLLLTLQDAIPDHQDTMVNWLFSMSKLIAQLLNVLNESMDERAGNEKCISLRSCICAVLKLILFPDQIKASGSLSLSPWNIQAKVVGHASS